MEDLKEIHSEIVARVPEPILFTNSNHGLDPVSPRLLKLIRSVVCHRCSLLYYLRLLVSDASYSSSTKRTGFLVVLTRGS